MTEECFNEIHDLLMTYLPSNGAKKLATKIQEIVNKYERRK